MTRGFNFLICIVSIIALIQVSHKLRRKIINTSKMYVCAVNVRVLLDSLRDSKFV